MKSTDFLDVTLDLSNNIFKPFRKPNAASVYIDANSNHPGYIKKELPKMGEKRITSLSANAQIFDEAMTSYKTILNKSNYKNKTYEFKPQIKKRKTRKPRKVIYFQPPYCSSVKDNIGKKFLNLVKSFFAKDHIYHKVFNRNTLKLSYCCMTNIKSVICSHNQKLLKPKEGTPKKNCNCRKRDCPVNGNCLQEKVIYKAEVKTEECTKHYVGSTGRSFKRRYGEHLSDFRHEKNRENTALSAYIWKLQDKKTKFQIKWSILHQAKATTNSKSGCSLCNLERIEIALAERDKSLNKRNELQAKCPHFRGRYF